MGVDWIRRTLTVVVGVPTALKLLSYEVGMWVLATCLCCLSLHEFSSNIVPRITPISITSSPILIAGISICVAAWSASKEVHDAVMLLAVFLMCCNHLSSVKVSNQPTLVALMLDVFGLIFIVSGFSHAILLRYVTPYGLGFQIIGLCCAWSCDSGALVCGSIWGTTKLAPSISPGKTVVGAVGGVFVGALSVVLLFALPQYISMLPHSWLPSTQISLIEQVVLGLLLGVLCIVGDLVESLMKRVADVKDSGTFFPGHGGCLDRMDSFLFVSQALYHYCNFRKFT